MKPSNLVKVFLALIIFSIISFHFSYITSTICAYCVLIVSTILFLFRHDSAYVSTISCRPVHLFIFSYIIVGYLRPLDYLLGYNFEYLSIGSPVVIPKCLMLATVGLLSFYIGYISFSKKIIYKHKVYSSSERIFSALTSLFLVLLIITTPRSILFGGYGHDLTSTSSLYSYLMSWGIVFVSSFFIQLCLVSSNDDSLIGSSFPSFARRVGHWQNINILLYSLLVLNIGDRGPIITFALSYYLAYLICSKKSLSKAALLVIILVSALSLSFLGKTKQYREDNNIFERIHQTNESKSIDVEDSSIIPFLSELAGSYRCLSFSVDEVPSNIPYAYGGHQMSYITSVLPFVGSHLPSAGPSSKKVNHIIHGDYYTAGTGTSCLADLYLDFGIVGVILGLFLFGYFLRYSELQLFSDSYSLFIFCVAFYFCINVVYIPRNAILFTMKYALWEYLLILFCNLNSNK